MNFNHSYKTWYVIFISDLSKYICVFISATHRRMHFVNLRCHTRLRKKGVLLHCNWIVCDILKLLSTKLLKNRIENCHKVAKMGAGYMAIESPVKKNTQRHCEDGKMKNECREYRQQAAILVEKFKQDSSVNQSQHAFQGLQRARENETLSHLHEECRLLSKVRGSTCGRRALIFWR